MLGMRIKYIVREYEKSYDEFGYIYRMERDDVENAKTQLLGSCQRTDPEQHIG